MFERPTATIPLSEYKELIALTTELDIRLNFIRTIVESEESNYISREKLEIALNALGECYETV